MHSSVIVRFTCLIPDKDVIDQPYHSQRKVIFYQAD